MDERGNDDGAWSAGGSRYDEDAADLAAMGTVTVGDLLSTAARAVGARFPQFLALSLLVLTPAFLLRFGFEEWVIALSSRPLDDLTDGARIEAMASFGRLAIRGVDTVVTFFAQAMLMYTTVEHMAGRRASVGDSLRAGLSNFATIVGLAILNSAAVFLAAIACLVPGIVVYCILFASVPAAVVERIGPIAAMQRSSELTDGNRMTLFLALLVIATAYAGLFCVSACGLLGATGVDPEAAVALPPALRAASYVLDVMLSLFATMSVSALAAVFYARLRGIRDGVDADAIAREFE